MQRASNILECLIFEYDSQVREWKLLKAEAVWEEEERAVRMRGDEKEEEKGGASAVDWVDDGWKALKNIIY
jgi:hypothetical protein